MSCHPGGGGPPRSSPDIPPWLSNHDTSAGGHAGPDDAGRRGGSENLVGATAGTACWLHAVLDELAVLEPPRAESGELGQSAHEDSVDEVLLELGTSLSCSGSVL